MVEYTEDQTVTRVVQCPLFHVIINDSIDLNSRAQLVSAV